MSHTYSQFSTFPAGSLYTVAVKNLTCKLENTWTQGVHRVYIIAHDQRVADLGQQYETAKNTKMPIIGVYDV